MFMHVADRGKLRVATEADWHGYDPADHSSLADFPGAEVVLVLDDTEGDTFALQGSSEELVEVLTEAMSAVVGAIAETRTIFAVTYGTCPMRQATYDSIEGARAYIDRAVEVRGEEYRAQYGIVTSTITTLSTPWKDAR